MKAAQALQLLREKGTLRGGSLPPDQLKARDARNPAALALENLINSPTEAGACLPTSAMLQPLP